MKHPLAAEIAKHIRSLSLDMILNAKSGHPGLPLGCADFFAWLFSSVLRFSPSNPKWLGRDRFVLSAGHGSAGLYSTLFLNGYDYTLEDLKSFRKIHSKTPGHPEYPHCPGVEATTGPLGQGIANGVGMALGLQLAQARYGKQMGGRVFVLAGDGCMMEGISHEACSFAGHLGLGNLVLFYDANRITLDANLEASCSEDTHARFSGYGWDVVHIDGLDPSAFERLQVEYLEKPRKRPLLVMMETVIGYGLREEGTHKVHGEPPKPEDAIEAKKGYGQPQEPFYVSASMEQYRKEQIEKGKALEASWKGSDQLPSLDAAFLEKILKELVIPGAEMALRSVSSHVIGAVCKHLPQLVGASADLSGSDKTTIPNSGHVNRDDFTQNNIQYGVREFAMAAGMAGVGLTDLFIPFCGTFFTFSDYMRNAIRLAALSSYKIIYIFTHDSVFVGEDGPTHEPIEQLASLRAMPGLTLFRPGSFHEVKGAWLYGLLHHGPTAIILTRQNVPRLELSESISFAEGVFRGAYLLQKEESGRAIDLTFFATGSELSLAMDVAKVFKERGKNVRVVSVPSFSRFFAQEQGYIDSVIKGNLGLRVSIEAAATFGWDRFVGLEGMMMGIDRFGASGNYKDIVAEYGMNVDAIVKKVQERV